MRIAFQGEPGAYSEAAAIRFSDHADLLPCESFDDVFTAVATGKATHGILPVENSIGGSIHRNYDLLLEHDLPIVGEVQLDITHNLLVLPGTRLENSQADLLAPAGAGAVRALPSEPARRGGGSDVRHGRQRQAREGKGTDRRGGHRVRPRGAGVRSRDPEAGDPGLLRQHHALPPRQPHLRRGPAGRQDHRGLLAAQRAGLACSRRCRCSRCARST